MPIYEYQCRSCGAEFEALVRGGAAAPVCPACAGTDLERVLSMFAVSSEATAHASLQKARRDLTYSRARQDQLRHEQEEIREHVQTDYGLRVPEPQD